MLAAAPMVPTVRVPVILVPAFATCKDEAPPVKVTVVPFLLEPKATAWLILLLVPILMAVAFPLAPAMLMVLAPPVSRFKALAPLDWTDKAPALVGLMVLPMVMSAPVTVNVRLVVPPAAVNPSVAVASVKPLYVPA